MGLSKRQHQAGVAVAHRYTEWRAFCVDQLRDFLSDQPRHWFLYRPGTSGWRLRRQSEPGPGKASRGARSVQLWQITRLFSSRVLLFSELIRWPIAAWRLCERPPMHHSQPPFPPRCEPQEKRAGLSTDCATQQAEFCCLGLLEKNPVFLGCKRGGGAVLF